MKKENLDFIIMILMPIILFIAFALVFTGLEMIFTYEIAKIIFYIIGIIVVFGSVGLFASMFN